MYRKVALSVDCPTGMSGVNLEAVLKTMYTPDGEALGKFIVLFKLDKGGFVIGTGIPASHTVSSGQTYLIVQDGECEHTIRMSEVVQLLVLGEPQSYMVGWPDYVPWGSSD